jgi:hypothetical protein
MRRAYAPGMSVWHERLADARTDVTDVRTYEDPQSPTRGNLTFRNARAHIRGFRWLS